MRVIEFRLRVRLRSIEASVAMHASEASVAMQSSEASVARQSCEASVAMRRSEGSEAWLFGHRQWHRSFAAAGACDCSRSDFPPSQRPPPAAR